MADRATGITHQIAVKTEPPDRHKAIHIIEIFSLRFTAVTKVGRDHPLCRAQTELLVVAAVLQSVYAPHPIFCEFSAQPFKRRHDRRQV